MLGTVLESLQKVNEYLRPLFFLSSHSTEGRKAGTMNKETNNVPGILLDAEGGERSVTSDLASETQTLPDT